MSAQRAREGERKWQRQTEKRRGSVIFFCYSIWYTLYIHIYVCVALEYVAENRRGRGGRTKKKKREDMWKTKWNL